MIMNISAQSLCKLFGDKKIQLVILASKKTENNVRIKNGFPAIPLDE